MSVDVPAAAAKLPAHVVLVRRLAFVVIGVAEAVLVTGPFIWRLARPVLEKVDSGLDAGDWIAAGAVAVAIAGLVLARRSAVAAERSATTASKALDIAAKAASSAETSARAAEKSADADSRMVGLAEEQHHRGLGPKWLVDVEEPSRANFIVALHYDDGPNEILASVTLNGTAWEQSTATGMSEGHFFYYTAEHPCLHPGEVWQLRPTLPDGLDLMWAEVVVSITAIAAPTSEREKPLAPWHFVKSCDSPHRRVTRVRPINFRR